MEAIIFLLIILLAGIIYRLVENYIKIKKTRASFKKSLDKAGLPVIEVYSGKRPLHFLVDSGSDANHISKDVLKEIVITRYYDSEDITVGGIGGEVPAQLCMVEFEYNKRAYNEVFYAIDFGKAFVGTEEELGYKIDGVLGIDFFYQHSTVLDFSQSLMYNLE